MQSSLKVNNRLFYDGRKGGVRGVLEEGHVLGDVAGPYNFRAGPDGLGLKQSPFLGRGAGAEGRHGQRRVYLIGSGLERPGRRLTRVDAPFFLAADR